MCIRGIDFASFYDFLLIDWLIDSKVGVSIEFYVKVNI